jgi:bacteriorhodopsin
MVDTRIILQYHLGFGCIAMGLFSYGFARNYIQTKNSDIRRFKSITFLINFMTLFYYLIINVLYDTTNPTLDFMSPITLRYFDWFLTTPLILTDILLLDNPVVTDILFLCILDAIMILSGYIAYLAVDPIAIWTLFTFGMFNGIVVMYQLLKKFAKIAFIRERSIAERTIIFLAWYTLIVWTSFPLLFILSKTSYISHDVEMCCYVYIDIFAKGGFGMLSIGARDAIHKVNLKGRMVRFAKAVISVVPIEGTDTSVAPLPTDAELANMVSTNIPVNTSDRTVTTVDEQNNSTLTIRNTDLVESPPPRWQ